MTKKILFLFIFIVSIIAAAFAVATEENKGAATMELFGGYKGKVPFNHQNHQTRLKDCNACHNTFPKTPGVIQDMKSKGKLKKKQVMNKMCIKCHKAEKKAGNKTGPTTCSKCHVK